jgi:hypothetical protein
VIRVHRPDLVIISPDDWARVQTAIAERKRDMRSQCATRKHALSGTLRCGECSGPMRIKNCQGRADWNRRYYVCAQRARKALCSNSVHLPADEAERKLLDHIRLTVLDEIESTIRDAIRGEVRQIIEAAGDRTGEADRLRSEIEALRRERQQLVKLAAAMDNDPVAEVVDALRANQERARSLEQALTLATRPPIDPSAAERLEAAAVAQIERMRQQLDSGEAREALTALFPQGRRFMVGSGLWLAEGAASVPAVNEPSGSRTRLPFGCRQLLGIECAAGGMSRELRRASRRGKCERRSGWCVS